MIEIILPIRKEFSDKILSGEKKFEYRKNIPKERVSKIYIYESRGCGAIVGEITVGQVLCDTPEAIWNITKPASGIDHDSFINYFKRKTKAYAYPINTFTQYECPKNLSEFGLSTAPQNFVKIKK